MRGSRTALALLALGLACHGAEAGERVYQSPSGAWSIRYPSDWSVDDASAGFVQFRSPDQTALCGVHTRDIGRFSSTDALGDFLLARHAKNMSSVRGLKSVVRSRRRVTLAGGVVAVDALIDLVPGGRSESLITLAGDAALVVDCEGFAKDWPRLGPLYARIVRSLRVRGRG